MSRSAYPLTVREIFELQDKSNGGIRGYECPRNVLFTNRAHKIPTSKTRDFYYIASKRSNEPDPRKYSETLEENFKKHWISPNGKFLKEKRKNMYDDISKVTKFVPGPGAYFKETKIKTISSSRTSKAEKITFVDNAQWLAEDKPGIGKYTPKRDLVYSRTPTCFIVKDTPKKIKPKEIVGPGSYHDGIDSGNKLISARSSSFILSKSKKLNSVTESSRVNGFVPGVGTYKPDKNLVMNRIRGAVFLPYKFKRFAELAAKDKNWVPGPGSYDILPKIN